MKLRRLMWWISDTVWKWVLGNANLKKEYEDRKQRVLLSALSAMDPDEPYVIDGHWSWLKKDSRVLQLTLVFPEKPLAIMVFGPEVGRWEDCKQYCRNRSSWVKANEDALHVVETCKSLGIPLISVTWGELPTVSDKLGEGIWQ